MIKKCLVLKIINHLIQNIILVEYYLLKSRHFDLLMNLLNSFQYFGLVKFKKFYFKLFAAKYYFSKLITIYWVKFLKDYEKIVKRVDR